MQLHLNCGIPTKTKKIKTKKDRPLNYFSKHQPKEGSSVNVLYYFRPSQLLFNLPE